MSGGRARPCLLEGPGHAMRPRTHWRRTPADTRYDVERLEEVGPDTIRFLLGAQHGGSGWTPHRREDRTRIELTYCHHDVPAILDVLARVGQGTRLWFDAGDVNLEWCDEDRVIQHFPLCEPYRYQPCRDLSSDPRRPFGALTIPSIPELDQLAAAGIGRTLTVWSPPGRATEDEPDEDGSSEDDDVGEEGWDEEEDEDEELAGEVVATLRIGASGWFDGADSQLVAVSPTEVGYRERWDPMERGEVVLRPVEVGGRTMTALRWVVDELDRILDGFPAGRHLLRLVAGGTVEDRFTLLHDGDNGEETFAVRFSVEADELDVRAAARDLARLGPDDGGLHGTAGGMREDGAWRLVVPGRRREPKRKRVEVALERESGG